MLRPPVEAIHPASVPAIPNTMPGGIHYQAKLDGWRALAFIDAGHVVLQSRSEKIITDWVHFSEPVVALGKVFVVTHDAQVYAFGLKR